MFTTQSGIDTLTTINSKRVGPVKTRGRLTGTTLPHQEVFVRIESTVTENNYISVGLRERINQYTIAKTYINYREEYKQYSGRKNDNVFLYSTIKRILKNNDYFNGGSYCTYYEQSPVQLRL